MEQDTIRKPNHPPEDHGDAVCYFACGVAPSVAVRARGRLGVIHARTAAAPLAPTRRMGGGGGGRHTVIWR